MSRFSDPFDNVVDGFTSGTVPGGVCDGVMIHTAGNLAYTTIGGSSVTAHPVVAGQLVPVRVQSIDTGTTAGFLLGYHKP